MKKHHRPDGSFQNNEALNMTHKGVLNVLKWQLSRPAVKPINLPTFTHDHHKLHSNHQHSTLTWIGHATFLIQHQGLNIITDPHFSKRASPSQLAGPKRTTQPAIDFPDLPHIDVVLISHDHYDHLDERSLRSLG